MTDKGNHAIVISGLYLFVLKPAHKHVETCSPVSLIRSSHLANSYCTPRTPSRNARTVTIPCSAVPLSPQVFLPRQWRRKSNLLSALSPLFQIAFTIVLAS